MSLTREYRGHGLTFKYPNGWELTEEPGEDTFTVSVTDMGTFWSATVLQGRPLASKVLSEAVEAFDSEYDDVDEYPAESILSGMKASAVNLEFVSLELINCVYLRAVEIGSRTLFVMAQVTDHEREEYEPLFEEMSASLELGDDDSVEDDLSDLPDVDLNLDEENRGPEPGNLFLPPGE
ncbi:hypothetical protein SH668x_002188 [Planctomicrobium sp. SH668]|uniref:hypothetical protein n=1 Tax=Planctomicrobium sp. SH668 TaxID=3448126 RepID=UPI003F5B5C7C